MCSHKKNFSSSSNFISQFNSYFSAFAIVACGISLLFLLFSFCIHSVCGSCDDNQIFIQIIITTTEEREMKKIEVKRKKQHEKGNEITFCVQKILERKWNGQKVVRIFLRK